MDKKSASGASYNTGICHVMPCSIEEDMTAPTAIYFRPTVLKSDAMSESCGRIADDRGAAIMAAQFRGRGLLCAVDSPPTKPAAPSGTGDGGDGKSSNDNGSGGGGEPSSKRPRPALSKLPSGMTGVVLASSTGSLARKRDGDAATNARPLRIVERFDRVYSWQHQHSVETVVRDQCLGGAKADRCGLRSAQAWMELAAAIHDEIPLP